MFFQVGLLYFVSSLGFISSQSVNPDVLLNLDQLIQKHGYPVELHEVITEDGYILNLYRIPNGLEKDQVISGNRSAILLVHGQGGSPQNFVALGKKHGLAYYLADRGFDVWLFCARGVECQNPKKHLSLDWNKDPIYWNYSFYHLGLYDLSASIDVIINKTNQKQIYHLGHSLGAAQFYILVSERPEYNKKIKMNINYAPLVIMKGFDHPLMQAISFFSTAIKNIYGALGMYETIIPSMNKMLSEGVRKFCAHPKWVKTCKTMLWLFGSHVSVLIEDEVVPFAWYKVPRLSIIQLTHFMDNLNRGDFRKYDYGPQKNVAVYGRKLPPAYNLTACTVPNAFFNGKSDTLTMPEDIQATITMLPNVIMNYNVRPKFVHLDFLFAKNATHMVYQPTVKLLKNFDAGIVLQKYD